MERNEAIDLMRARAHELPECMLQDQYNAIAWMLETDAVQVTNLEVQLREAGGRIEFASKLIDGLQTEARNDKATIDSLTLQRDYWRRKADVRRLALDQIEGKFKEMISYIKAMG